MFILPLLILNIKQGSYDYQFLRYYIWFDPSGNQTQVYNFRSRQSIHSITKWLANFYRLRIEPASTVLKAHALSLDQKTNMQELKLQSESQFCNATSKRTLESAFHSKNKLG